MKIERLTAKEAVRLLFREPGKYVSLVVGLYLFSLISVRLHTWGGLGSTPRNLVSKLHPWVRAYMPSFEVFYNTPNVCIF